MNRKVVAYLFGFYVFFTVYNTLIPFSFDYGLGDLPEQLSRVNWKFYFGSEDIALTDIVGNIILFMPFGFLLYMLLFYRGSRHPILLATLAGAALSLGIEIVQLFIQSRNSAPHDLLNNALGSWIGAVAGSIYAVRLASISRRIFYDLLDRKPFLLLITLIGLGQFVAAVMPFTVSISVSSLAESVKEANIVPFTYLPIGTLVFGYPNEKTEYQISDAALDSLRAREVPEEVLSPLAGLKDLESCRRSRFLNEVKRVIGGRARDKYRKLILRFSELKEQAYFSFSKMFENLLYWMAAGYLLMICYRIYWRHKAYGPLLLFALPLAYFLFLEGFQLIITSRISDINDIISGYSGVLLGILLYKLLKPLRRKNLRSDLDLLRIPLVIYGIFVLYAGFQPFDWSFDAEVLAKDLLPENLIPFYAYFRKTSLWNMYDLIATTAFMVPITFYWSFRRIENGASYHTQYILTTLAGLLTGMVIEFSQLLSFERIAEITDILAYGAGGAIGTFLVYYYHEQVAPTLGLIRKGQLRL